MLSSLSASSTGAEKNKLTQVLTYLCVYDILIDRGVVPKRNPLPANESSGTTGTLHRMILRNEETRYSPLKTKKTDTDFYQISLHIPPLHIQDFSAMTFIISATVTIAFAYFVFALVACLHDCLMVRYRRQFSAPAIELDFEALSAELDEEMEIFEAALFPVAIAQSTTAPALPTKIRELRDYIRANNLQSVVKERIGKTVSKCSKDELMAAIA